MYKEIGCNLPLNNPLVIPGMPLIEYTFELFQNLVDVIDLK